MTFPLPTKPYYLLGERPENIKRPQEMNAGSSELYQISADVGNPANLRRFV
jgi:hypothetical protein